MSIVNSCRFIGNLGSDPETKHTPSGAQVTTFRIAVSEKWKDQAGEQQERTEWVGCVAWRKLAEICALYLKKGMPVAVEGRLQTRTWDKDDGTKGYRTELVVENMKMLGKKDQNGGGERAYQSDEDAPPAYVGASADEDLAI